MPFTTYQVKVKAMNEFTFGTNLFGLETTFKTAEGGILYCACVCLDTLLSLQYLIQY